MSDPKVEFLANGPIFVKGPLKFVAADGTEEVRDRPNIALCRCGQSSEKPFCDGTHKEVGFEGPEGNLFDV